MPTEEDARTFLHSKMGLDDEVKKVLVKKLPQHWQNSNHNSMGRVRVEFTEAEHRAHVVSHASRLSRSSLATLVKVVTGQNNLNYLTTIIFPKISGLCRFCEGEDETFIHLVNECPVFLGIRTEIR